MNHLTINDLPIFKTAQYIDSIFLFRPQYSHPFCLFLRTESSSCARKGFPVALNSCIHSKTLNPFSTIFVLNGSIFGLNDNFWLHLDSSPLSFTAPRFYYNFDDFRPLTFVLTSRPLFSVFSGKIIPSPFNYTQSYPSPFCYGYGSEGPQIVLPCPYHITTKLLCFDFRLVWTKFLSKCLGHHNKWKCSRY